MIVSGYIEIFSQDEVRVFDRQSTDLPSSLVVSQGLSGFETYQQPLNTLGHPFEEEEEGRQARRRRRRRRRRNRKTPKNCILLKLDGADPIEFEGFIYAKTYSQLAQFLVENMEPRSECNDDFESWYFQNQKRSHTPDFFQEAEEKLIETMEYQSEYARKDLNRLFHYEHEGKNWYFEENSYSPAIIDQTTLSIGSYDVPRVHFVHQNHDLGITFDGKGNDFIDPESPLGLRALQSFEEGTLYSQALLDPLAFVHMRVIACLRVPTLEEYEASGIQDREDPPALSSSLKVDFPAYGYLYDSRLPLVIEDPKTVKMIDQIDEVIAVLSRTDQGITIADRTPEMPSTTFFTDEPSFLLFALPVEVE